MTKKRTIKITKTRTFYKTATIEIEYPDNLLLSEASDWLYDNTGWEEDLDEKVMNAELFVEFDTEFDQTRYDIYEEVTETQNVYGGTL